MTRTLHIVASITFVGTAAIALVTFRGPCRSGTSVSDPLMALHQSTSPSRRRTAAEPGARLANHPRIQKAYGQLPMAFEVNRGQTDARVQFLGHGRGYTVLLAATEAVLAFQTSTGRDAPSSMAERVRTRPADIAIRGAAALADPVLRLARHAARRADAPSVMHIRLVGAAATAAVTGEQRLPGTSNYFIGNDPQRWHTHVPTYAQVRSQHVYPGIDVVYYGRQGQLESDFVVAAGASPTAIRLAITGTGSDAPLHVDADGNLVASLDAGQVCFHKPVVYQPLGAQRSSVEGRYVLTGAYEVGFEIGAVDPTRPVVIDPALSYSTYLGGSSYDSGLAIALHQGTGNAYMTGSTLSTDFPTVNPLQPTNQAGYDAFVAALDPTGSTLLYSTYLGGNGDDIGRGIAVDGAGNVYLTGNTFSTDFPTANPLQPLINGPSDAFVAALDPTGSTLLYSTYLGGSNDDTGNGIAVDSAGNAYVTGSTHSADFPTLNAVQPMSGGSLDAFVTELGPTGSLLYSTYLGGSCDDVGRGIAVDGAGCAYVTGWTCSSNFPTANPLQSFLRGSADAFVAALDPAGSTLRYATYLGGGDNEAGNGIAVDGAGHAYVTGFTLSTDFPTANPLQSTNHGSSDAFVAALDDTGSTLLYATYLGGSGLDFGQGVAVDGAGQAYVTGWTGSTDFPTANPVQPTNHGRVDAFVAALDDTGSALVYSTYLGGNSDDYGFGVAVTTAGDAYVIGETASTDFPTLKPLQPTNHGRLNVFVTRIVP